MRALSGTAVDSGAAEGKARKRSRRHALPLAPARQRFGAPHSYSFILPVIGRTSIHRLGLMATIALMMATVTTGFVMGGHVGTTKDKAALAVAAGLRSIGFRVSEVRVTGAHQLTVPELFERIGLNSTSLTTLGFDAEQARRKLVEIPWIKTASVRVLLPGTIDVAVVEREPFALWQRDGRVNLVDREGGIIGAYEDERFANLPVVVGEGADKRVVEIRQLLDLHPLLRQQVRAAVLVAERRWTLKLADGVDVMLPEEGAQDALASLIRIDGQSGLLKRDIAAVDLRVANRVIVRLTDRAAQIRSDALRPRARSATPASPPPPVKPSARTI
ncbi:MAG: cell division protein FtsQ/DivIB [Hyphomicrobiales bacterium]|nr:cell division protein FtsQ/DivIB [Hyphomicrobiales bacterium]